MKDYNCKPLKTTFMSLLTIAGLQLASSVAFGAAPETRIEGTNTQEITLTGLVGAVGMTLNGDLEAETSIGSVHQGSLINGPNVQSVDWQGGSLLGVDILGGVAVASIAGDACGKLSIASVGSSTCSQGDLHMGRQAQQ